MSLLTPKEKAKLEQTRRILAEGGNPFEHISRRLSEDKPYKVSDTTRLAISPGRTYWPKASGNKRRQRPGEGSHQSSLISTTGIKCMSCSKDVTFHTSTLGKMLVGKAIKSIADNELINDTLVETESILIFPVIKTGRVCKDCKSKLQFRFVRVGKNTLPLLKILSDEKVD